jgi:HEAT repeat protein
LHWRAFCSYAVGMLLLSRKNGEIRFQHALFQDFFLYRSNIRRLAAGSGNRRHTVAPLLLSAGALSFSQAFLHRLLHEGPPATRTALLMRLTDGGNAPWFYRELVFSALPAQPSEVLRIAIGVAYILALDPDPAAVAPVADALAQLCADEDGLVRAAAARFLGIAGHPLHHALLRSLWRDPSDLVKLKALTAFGFPEDIAAIPFSGIRDLDLHLQREVLRQTIEWLSRRPVVAPEAAAALVSEMAFVLESPSDLDVRLCALQVLLLFDDDRSRQAIQAVANDPSWTIRLQVAAAQEARPSGGLRGLPPAMIERLPFLADLFRAFRQLQVSGWLHQLGVVGNLELETRLKDVGFWRFVEAVGRLLGSMGTDLVTYLLLLARSSAAAGSVRRRALLLLGHLAGQDTAPALEELSHDPTPLVAESARWAFDHLVYREPYPYPVVIHS